MTNAHNTVELIYNLYIHKYIEIQP